MRGAYKAPAPARAFRFKVPGGAKAVDTYGELVKAWRAGAVTDFYYGTRSDDDPTLIWIVDGVTFAKSDLAGVRDRISGLCARSGVTSITFGAMWCGYQALVVTFSSGVVVTQAYDGVRVTETATRSELAS